MQDNTTGRKPSNNGASGFNGTKSTDQIKSLRMKPSLAKYMNQENTDSAAKISTAVQFLSSGWGTTSRDLLLLMRILDIYFIWLKKAINSLNNQVLLFQLLETYQLCVIYDRRNMADSDDISKESMKKFMPILNDCYPELLNNFYVFGANLFYRAMWKVVSIFVSKRT